MRAVVASVVVHAGLFWLASLIGPPRIQVAPPATVAFTLVSQGTAEAVPRAARPAPRSRVKRGPRVAQAAAVPAGPAAVDSSVAEGEGAPGAGAAGPGDGGGDPFARNPRFRWVWKLSPGRYRLFIPPGYDLEMQLTFESVQDNRVELTSFSGDPIATFTKRGPLRWSYPNRNPTGRVLLLNGPDRHDCRYGQVDLRARVGFEDRTDRDCDEPDVFLRLVRR